MIETFFFSIRSGSDFSDSSVTKFSMYMLQIYLHILETWDVIAYSRHARSTESVSLGRESSL